MKIEEFVRTRDIISHLYTAVDDVNHSGFALLEGLQDGKATVDILYDGHRVYFRKHEEPPPETVVKEDAVKPRRK